MNAKKIAPVIALVCLVYLSGTAHTAPAQEQNEGYRYEVKSHQLGVAKPTIIRTDHFKFTWAKSVVSEYRKDRDNASTNCSNEVSIFVEKASKVNPDGTRELVTNSVIAVGFPNVVWLNDYNAPLKGPTGVRRGRYSTIIYISEKCPEERP